jgi:two-component system chemotaxis response regulator CheB
MPSERIVVMGASAGGVRALQLLVSHLPVRFPAPILVVQHIGSYPSILPQLIARSGPLPAAHAENGEPIEPGRILVAPPDCHMLAEDGVIHLSHGAKEQYTRPAIDPLFRSAALSWGARTIGVLLTGHLDDGTDGLQAIKQCGGVAIVQDPEEAETPSMPLSALRYVDVDFTVGLAEIGPLLGKLASEPAGASREPAREVKEENEMLLGNGDYMKHLRAIGSPSTFACPECNGTLWEVNGSRPRRFRCHTGHAFTLRALHHAQGTATDEALWSALRALQERQLLLEALAESHRDAGDADEARRLDDEADASGGHIATLRALIGSMPPPPE